jgi:hypothetical protein
VVVLRGGDDVGDGSTDEGALSTLSS